MKREQQRTRRVSTGTEINTHVDNDPSSYAAPFLTHTPYSLHHNLSRIHLLLPISTITPNPLQPAPPSPTHPTLPHIHTAHNLRTLPLPHSHTPSYEPAPHHLCTSHHTPPAPSTSRNRPPTRCASASEPEDMRPSTPATTQARPPRNTCILSHHIRTPRKDHSPYI